MATNLTPNLAPDLRQAAEYARSFADLVASPETRYAFKELAAKWEKEAEELEAAARLKSLENER
jgi:erythromycin esterase-like protein